MENIFKLTNSSRLFMVFSAISVAKKPWKRELNPSHPYVVIDLENRTAISTADGSNAIDSFAEDTWETVKGICNRIK
jgi:hypothetical protein